MLKRAFSRRNSASNFSKPQSYDRNLPEMLIGGQKNVKCGAAAAGREKYGFNGRVSELNGNLVLFLYGITVVE